MEEKHWPFLMWLISTKQDKIQNSVSNIFLSSFSQKYEVHVDWMNSTKLMNIHNLQRKTKKIWSTDKKFQHEVSSDTYEAFLHVYLMTNKISATN